jgi:hypothetical protein
MFLFLRSFVFGVQSLCITCKYLTCKIYKNINWEVTALVGQKMEIHRTFTGETEDSTSSNSRPWIHYIVQKERFHYLACRSQHNSSKEFNLLRHYMVPFALYEHQSFTGPTELRPTSVTRLYITTMKNKPTEG